MISRNEILTYISNCDIMFKINFLGGVLMNKIKKIMVAIVCVIAVTGFTTSINATEIVGKTVYTDIIASINDYNIESYNINGYTGVVAEDLRNYGFDVEWKQDEFALYITRSNSNIVQATYIAPEIPKSRIGIKAHDLYQTDIKTYINGNLVTSYNINGKTIIHFDDLSVYGEVSYNDTNRRLDLDIDGLNYKISAPQKFDSKFSPSGLYFKTNSAGGIQVRWTANNNTNKTINYYTTTYYMFNSVGDFAYDRYGNNSFSLNTVGPVFPGETLIDFTGKYEGEVYDVPCNNIYLRTIELEYSDGTQETIYYNHIGFEDNGKWTL